MRALNAPCIALVAGLLSTAPVIAQESRKDEDRRVLDSAAMDAALAGHESAVDQQRAELVQLLSRPEVRDLALERGIDIGRVESAAAGLSDGQMKGVAPLVAKVTPLVQEGGLGSITISVAAIIVILLLLILVT